MSGSPVAPGQVWWCDGVALSFEAYFKRRPALVLDVTDTGVVVIPLSSRRHYGQEQLVTHARGVSYFAGSPREVPGRALLQQIGPWDGFDAWRGSVESGRARPRAGGLLDRLRRRFLGDHSGGGDEDEGEANRT